MQASSLFCFFFVVVIIIIIIIIIIILGEEGTYYLSRNFVYVIFSVHDLEFSNIRHIRPCCYKTYSIPQVKFQMASSNGSLSYRHRPEEDKKIYIYYAADILFFYSTRRNKFDSFLEISLLYVTSGQQIKKLWFHLNSSYDVGVCRNGVASMRRLVKISHVCSSRPRIISTVKIIQYYKGLQSRCHGRYA